MTREESLAPLIFAKRHGISEAIFTLGKMETGRAIQVKIDRCPRPMCDDFAIGVDTGCYPPIPPSDTSDSQPVYNSGYATALQPLQAILPNRLRYTKDDWIAI